MVPSLLAIRAQGQTQMQTREADGLSLIYFIPKEVGKRMVVDRQKVKTSSESRSYSVAGRLEVRADRMVRQVGTESRNKERSKSGELAKENS